jgi:signal transduction histidine kinase/DNA-binding response OmpR family regulator
VRLLNRISISKKLTLFGVATSVIVVLLMGFALALCDLRNIHVGLTRSYGTMADVIGQSCSTAMAENNRDVASRLLKVLDEDHEIIAAELLDQSGDLFVEYMAPQDAHTSGQIRTGGIPHASLTFERPIMIQGGPIGRIRLVVSSNRLWSQCWEHLQLILLVTLASVLIAIISAGYLQRMISGPVVHLVETARTVSRTGDYSLRARRETADEFGELCEALNEMLGQIESRDAELDLHRRHLEALVRLRTEALEQMTREALAASVAKSRFLANMSHEIRTPMNAILGFADLLKRGADDGDPKTRDEFLTTIATSGKHLLTLINDVLDLSKIESGKMHVDLIESSPHQVISEAVSVLRAKAIEKGLGLEFHWEGPVAPTIQTDPSRLRQLLINLLGNAVKFTAQGGVRVTARIDAAAQQLQVAVFDTGIGIAAEKLEEIFEPFAQADASVTRRFGGTGLGLAISRRVAEALGGTLTVESEVGCGSTFTAIVSTGEIDSRDLLDSPADDFTTMDESEDLLPQPLAPGRILLVEDGETNRKLIRIMLERQGLDVAEAENGRIGLERAMAEDFDLILMDMQMPVMDGYTAVRELRTQGVTTPIVALTAHAMAGDAEKCLAAGCSNYLSKPIDEPRLLAILRNDLRGTVDALAGVTLRRPRPSDDDSSDEICSTLPVDDREFCEIIGEFIDRARQQAERLHEAVDAENWNEVADIAHWLKGSGGTAGFEGFTAPAGRLERLARNRQLDEIPALLDKIESMISRLAVPVVPGVA